MGTQPVETWLVGTEPVGTGPVGTGPVGTGPVGTRPVGTTFFRTLHMVTSRMEILLYRLNGLIDTSHDTPFKQTTHFKTHFYSILDVHLEPHRNSSLCYSAKWVNECIP